MQKYRYVIVGGGAAGVSAAETIRAADPQGSIAIVSDEPYLMYSRVMLSKPNFFLGKIPFDQIYLKGKQWYADNHIDFLGGKKAVALDAAANSLTLSDGSSLTYEKLLLATGVEARKWQVKGSDKKGIHYLRSLEDGQAIMAAIKETKRGVTIGGGFISFEMADLLRMANIDTTMILRESYFWQPTLDEASGLMIENALTKGGVKLIKNAEVTEALGDDRVSGLKVRISRSDLTRSDLSVETQDHDLQELPCEMVICGIGVTNPLEWMSQGGVAVNHGIVANEFMETNVPNIWTAGDIAEYNDLLLEEHVIMGNWVNAREQGRIAGLNMSRSFTKPASGSAPERQPFKFVSFYTTQGFGLSIAFVGDASPGPDRIIIPRGSPEMNSYARLIIVGKELVGATMINRTSEMSTISNLIHENIDVSGKLKELGDTGFDLKTLL